MKIKAAVVREAAQPFSIEDLELDDPAAGEVLVRIHAVGICHTDVIVRDQWYPVPLPAVLGHEGAGIVEAVGAGVTSVAPGDNVVLTFASCGTCKMCASDNPAYCHEFMWRNIAGCRPDGTNALHDASGDVHGSFFGQSSFASYALATEGNVVKVDPSADLSLIGPLGCGVQTGAGAVLNSLRPEPGSTLVVFGTGAVGLSAIMAAKVAGCSTIIGIDIRRHRLAVAEELGATHTIDASTTTTVVPAIQGITGAGADFAVETTGSPSVLRNAVEALGPLGVCGIVGAARIGTEVTFDMANLAFGRTVRGIVEGDSRPQTFIPHLLELHRQGRFPFERIIRHYDFEDINQAVHDAETGETIKPVLRLV